MKIEEILVFWVLNVRFKKKTIQVSIRSGSNGIGEVTRNLLTPIRGDFRYSPDHQLKGALGQHLAPGVSHDNRVAETHGVVGFAVHQNHM